MFNPTYVEDASTLCSTLDNPMFLLRWSNPHSRRSREFNQGKRLLILCHQQFLGVYLFKRVSKFRSIPLEQGKNAELIPKFREDGGVKSHELKHYVTLLCGLDKTQWGDRNQSTRAIDRLENSTEVDPDTYLEVTGKLLNSDDPHELAVGIVAATGRRPHEVLARAKFSPVEGKPSRQKSRGFY